VLANGALEREPSRKRAGDYAKFAATLEKVCHTLALGLWRWRRCNARRGNRSARAPSDRAARQVAQTISGSPLVKTAIAAPTELGRILAPRAARACRSIPTREIWLAE